MRKALCIVKSRSLEELNQRLEIVRLRSKYALTIYLAFMTPDTCIYIYLCFMEDKHIADDDKVAYLVLLFYFLNMMMVIFELMFAIMSYKIINDFGRIMMKERRNLKSAIFKVGIGIVIIEVLIGKTIQNAIYPVK